MMGWKTMAAINREELDKSDCNPYSCFDDAGFVKFHFDRDLSFCHNLCPIWADIEKEVSLSSVANNVFDPLLILYGKFRKLSSSFESFYLYFCRYGAFSNIWVSRHFHVLGLKLRSCGHFAPGGKLPTMPPQPTSVYNDDFGDADRPVRIFRHEVEVPNRSKSSRRADVENV